MVVTPAVEDDIKAQDAADLVESAILGKDGDDGIDRQPDRIGQRAEQTPR
jgi:hypothetical protein